MTRTLKVLIGAAALAIIGVSTASAQTGPLLGRELYLFDGGAGTTQNTVRLIAPPADTITSSWTFMLPKTQGGLNFILVNTDGTGKTEWQDGNGIFWRLNGNTGTTPWNGLTGNYYGTGDATDLALRAGGSNMKFWFGAMTFPVMTLNQYGAVTLQTADGYNGLVIGGQPGGTTGPDAGIVLDCALPPAVGIEVNAKATGILMPTCPLTPAPLVGISLKAQNTGIEIDDAPTGLYITDATTGINVTGSTRSINATGTVRLNTVALDASATQVLARNASNDVVYRNIAATGTIVTTPSGGTVNTLPLWSPSSSELGNSIITQDAGATTATVGGILSVTGNTSLQGTLTIDAADVALSPTHVRVLTQSGAGLVGYRTIPANGDIVVSNGPLTNNGAVYTNSTGQLQAVALTDGQLLIGSTGNAPSANTLTAGSGITITNAPGSITIAVTNPVPAGTTTSSTLRWNGTAWEENLNLLSTAAGNTTNNGTLTLSVANTALSASHTRILTQDATTGLVGHRTVAATGDIVTAPIAGTTGRITRWTASNQIGDGSLDDNGSGTLSRANNIAINPGAGNTLSTNGSFTADGSVTLGDAAADVITLSGSTVDISNVPTVATATNLLRRNATGDIEVSSASFAVIPGGTLAANRNVRTDGAGGLTVGPIALNGGVNEVTGVLPIANGGTNSGTALNNNRIMVSSGGAIVEANALTDGQILIGSTGGAPAAGTISSSGSTVTITNGAGTINLEVANPLPAPAVGNTNYTLRSNGTAWVASSALQNNGTDVTATGGLAVNGSTTLGNDDADAHVIRGIVGLNAVAGQAGGITIGNSGAGITNLNSSTINAPNLPSTGVNTDEFVVTDGTTLRTATVATMIGGTPWVVGGNTTAPANGIIGIATASTQDLQFYVNNAQAISIDDATLLTTINNDLTVAENTTLGNNAGDLTSIVGNLNVNSAFATAQAVNVNTAAAAHTFTLGNPVLGNTTALNSAAINVPNIPAAASATEIVVRDGSFNLGTRTIGAGTNIITGSGTNNTLTKWTSANTIGDGSITDNGTTVNFSTAAVQMPNLPNDPSASTWIVTYNNTTGALEKKDLGAPVAKVKSAKTPITGAPPTRTFSINDDFVTANSVITVTLQDGSDVNDYTVSLASITPTPGAGADFTIRLSGVIGAGNTKTVHYTITNP